MKIYVSSAIFLLSASLLLFLSCDDKPPKAAVDPAPLTMIPSNFQVVAEIDLVETLKIPGISSRLKYEAKRRPSLQILPLNKIKDLYLGAESVKELENSGGLFIAVTKDKCDLSKIVSDYEVAQKDNKEIVIGKKKFGDMMIHTIRDRKQIIGACQVGPATFICGPEKQLIEALTIKDKGISTSDQLKELLAKHKGSSLKIFVLSSENMGAFMQNFKFFNQLTLGLKSTEKGAAINGNSFSEMPEDNERMNSALGIASMGLLFKFNNVMKPQDVKIAKKSNTTSFTANFTTAALKEIFEKD